MSAGQLTWCMSAPHPIGGEVDDGGEARADDHPEQLVPIKEGDAVPLRLDLIVERGPEHRDGLHDEQQVPPAPLAALGRDIHGGGCYAILVGQEKVRFDPSMRHTATRASHVMAILQPNAPPPPGWSHEELRVAARDSVRVELRAPATLSSEARAVTHQRRGPERLLLPDGRGAGQGAVIA